MAEYLHVPRTRLSSRPLYELDQKSPTSCRGSLILDTCATVSVIVLVTYRLLIIDVKLDFDFNVGLGVFFCIPYFIMNQI